MRSHLYENDFYSYSNKTHFPKKGFAHSLVLKVTVFGTRKWSNQFISQFISQFNEVVFDKLTPSSSVTARILSI